jgi:GNAT superfamily N-acetyltransferase
MATVTAPDTVEVVRHQAGDQEDIFRFYAETFGQDLTEGSRRRWQWQYAENPEREAAGPAIWVAREGGDVLGQYASMPVRLWWDGRYVRSSWGMDVFLRPQARGKGVGARLFTAWSDHVEVALGLGLTPSSYGLFQKLRYHDVGPVPFFQKVMDARAVAARRLGPSLGALAARLLSLGWSLRYPDRPCDTAGVSVERIEAFGPEFDALWERARASYAMCVRRDAAYLTWKYASCPHREYALHAARRAGTLVGFAVSRHQDYRGLRLGWIVDLFADANDQDAKDALLTAVLEEFRRSGVARAQAFAMNSALGAGLRRRGFRPADSPMQFCVRTQVSDAPLADRGRWHVVFGDSDMDR